MILFLFCTGGQMIWVSQGSVLSCQIWYGQAGCYKCFLFTFYTALPNLGNLENTPLPVWLFFSCSLVHVLTLFHFTAFCHLYPVNHIAPLHVILFQQLYLLFCWTPLVWFYLFNWIAFFSPFTSCIAKIHVKNYLI